MIEFNDLVNALAQWRLNNGQATSAPLVAQPEQSGAAAPPRAPAGRIRPTAPPPMRTKAASIPPPAPLVDLNEFSDVPEDAIEEDGADFQMSFGGAPPPALEEVVEVAEHADEDAEPLPELLPSRRVNTDSFGDGESTMVGSNDRDGNNN